MSKFNFARNKKKKSKINKKEVHDHKPSSLKNRGCIYFKNLNKKKFKKKKGAWNIKRIRRESFRNKICPFYFSREIIFESHLLILEFKNFFSTELLGLNLKKIFRASFLIIDSAKNLDSVLANLAISEISSLVLNDSIRGILYLKKRILATSSQKFKSLSDRIPLRKYTNFNQIIFFRKKFNKRKNFGLNFNTNVNLFSERMSTLITILSEISQFIKFILRKKTKINITINQFFNILVCKLKKHEFCSNYLLHFTDYVALLGLKSETLDYRFLSSLKCLSWFLTKFGILLESTNENFRLISIKNATSTNLIVDSKIFLCCFEIPIFSRIIYENILSLIIFTTQNSFLHSNLSTFDQSQIYYGNLRLILKKCFASYQEIILGKSYNNIIRKNRNSRDFYFSKNIISTILQFSESSSNGVLCLFSSYSIFLEIIKNLNNPLTLGKIKNKRNIFIETFIYTLDLNVLEEYKTSCDLGYQSIFFGLSDGIVLKANLENHYSRCILKIQSKLMGLNKFKKFYHLWQKIFSSQDSFSDIIEKQYNTGNEIYRKFFGSKKDYGIFLKIRQIYDIEKNTKESKIDVIRSQKIIKEESLSNPNRIDQFFKFLSFFNLGN